MKQLIDVAMGRKKASLVLKNATVLNVFTEEWLEGDVAIYEGCIAGIGSYEGEQEMDCKGRYVVPGLIDAHMHMESSMVMPLELSKMLLKAGTTTIVADPHELVNVAGMRALDFLLDATCDIPLSVYFMIPSAVPCLDEETNGAGELTAEMMEPYVNHPRVLGLGEVMRFADVLAGEERMLKKTALFRAAHIDGHAPGISGKAVQAYRAAGIENDHECSTAQEAIEKARAGLYIFMRQGSGARNAEALLKGFVDAKMPLDMCMFCTDDKHLEDIEKEGHINMCVRIAIALGVPAAKAYAMASYRPAVCYGLKTKGAVAAGFDADLLILDELTQAWPAVTIQNGRIVDAAYLGGFATKVSDESLLHTVKAYPIESGQLALTLPGAETDVCEMIPGELITRHLREPVPQKDGLFLPDREYNKMCVIERHGRNHKIGIAPLKGFGISGGAIATSVAHDSHNIIAAGDNDEDIRVAVNELIRLQGGSVIAAGGEVKDALPLPVGGLMSLQDCESVQRKTGEMVRMACRMGVQEGVDPFITLSFMALPVIPQIRLTERGLVYLE